MAHRLSIPASRLADAQNLVARFARKASKLDMTPPSIEVEREYKLHWIEDMRGRVIAGPFEGVPPVYIEDRIMVTATAMVDVTVSDERPVIAGWRFAAVIEGTPAGNVLRTHPDHEGDLPERFRQCTSECDHCQTERQRNQTFVVQSVETGEYMQVGRSCLKDFVGEASPEAWMAAFEFEKRAQELGHDVDASGYAIPTVSVPLFLAAAAASIRENGYVPAKSWDQPTGLRVFFCLTSTSAKERRSALDPITDADRDMARAAMAWIAGDDAGSSDYIHNVRTYCACQDVEGRAANTVASLIQTYRRHIGRKAEKATKANEHLPGAEVKKRLRGLELTLVGDHSFETDYGLKWILRFEDEDGRCVVWRTSSPPDIEPGDRVILDGTVKALSEYRGTLQTDLSRCRIKERIDPEAKAA